MNINLLNNLKEERKSGVILSRQRLVKKKSCFINHNDYSARREISMSPERPLSVTVEKSPKEAE